MQKKKMHAKKYAQLLTIYYYYYYYCHKYICSLNFEVAYLPHVTAEHFSLVNLLHISKLVAIMQKTVAD